MRPKTDTSTRRGGLSAFAVALLALALMSGGGTVSAARTAGGADGPMPERLFDRAEAGDPRAQLALGYSYALGEGVIQDFVEAHKWLNLAAAAGEPRAMEARERLAERMTAGQIARAQRLAREWVPAQSGTAPPPDLGGGGPDEPEPPAEESDADRVSELGRRGVARIQRGLKFLGYAAGPVDGLAGEKTRAAIRAFQRDQGLPADGRATRSVLDALRAAAIEREGRASTPGPAADPREALRDLIDELFSLTEEAQERGAAAPGFLDDLRGLARRYEDVLARPVP